MKIFCVILFIFLVFPAFSEQTEVAFFLFMPNSSNRFVNEAQARRQLDDIARNLLSRDLSQGQIHVGGYAADARNEIDPVELSRNRALFVIQELQRRGVPAFLFSDPVANGAVNIWGDNINETRRSQNRRVRILLDDIVIPAIVPTPEPVIQEPLPVQIPADQEPSLVLDPAANEQSAGKFLSCIICLILLVLFLITLFFLIREIMSFTRRKIII